MGEASYRLILHDRDSIYSAEIDSALKAMDLRVLKTPFQAPQANAFCERLIGTVRRECLDFLHVPSHLECESPSVCCRCR
jgi:transposase InsO family protein